MTNFEAVMKKLDEVLAAVKATQEKIEAVESKLQKLAEDVEEELF